MSDEIKNLKEQLAVADRVNELVKAECERLRSLLKEASRYVSRGIAVTEVSSLRQRGALDLVSRIDAAVSGLGE